MSLEELLPQIHSLAQPDKLQLIKILADDLMVQESAPKQETGSTFPVWTPYGATQAAAVLLQALEEDQEER